MSQCQTQFENYQCGGYWGHQGPCQDIDYDGAQGEQFTYYKGLDWTKTISHKRYLK